MAALTDEQKNRAVAEAFLGWKPCAWERVVGGVGYRCTTHDWYSMINRCKDGAPDLTEPANAWALLVALWDRDYDCGVTSDQSMMVIWKEVENGPRATAPINNDRAAALRDAAFALIEKLTEAPHRGR